MAPYTISDFRRDVRQPYAWPGGYPRYFVTADGAALSIKGAKQQRREVLQAIRDDDRSSGWRIVGADVNWEDSTLTCDHTGAPIESAYGEPDKHAPECSALDGGKCQCGGDLDWDSDDGDMT